MRNTKYVDFQVSPLHAVIINGKDIFPLAIAVVRYPKYFTLNDGIINVVSNEVDRYYIPDHYTYDDIVSYITTDILSQHPKLSDKSIKSYCNQFKLPDTITITAPYISISIDSKIIKGNKHSSTDYLAMHISNLLKSVISTDYIEQALLEL